MTTRAPLALWTAFVLGYAALQYTSRLSGEKPDDHALYEWSTAAGGLVIFGVIALIVYGIAGLGERRRLLALRRPTSWREAAVIGAVIAAVMFVLLTTLGPLLDPGQEQGLTPDRWIPSRAAEYVVNGIVVAGVAPVVEEITFRGLGYSLLARYGRWVAIVLVGVAFALAHGLVEAFPFLAALGSLLAYLRSRVDSVYPGMIVHAAFNATALVVSVAH